jgi:hypothetical protein
VNSRLDSSILLDFAVRLVLSAARAELAELETRGGRLFVLCFAIVPLFAFLALERDNFSGHVFLFLF